jgi:hypothetical protein
MWMHVRDHRRLQQRHQRGLFPYRQGSWDANAASTDVVPRARRRTRGRRRGKVAALGQSKARKIGRTPAPMKKVTGLGSPFSASKQGPGPFLILKSDPVHYCTLEHRRQAQEHSFSPLALCHSTPFYLSGFLPGNLYHQSCLFVIRAINFHMCIIFELICQLGNLELTRIMKILSLGTK